MATLLQKRDPSVVVAEVFHVVGDRLTYTASEEDKKTELLPLCNSIGYPTYMEHW